MYSTVIDIIKHTFESYPDRLAYSWIEDKKSKELTYREVALQVKNACAALVEIGIKHGEPVGLIADVSHHWILGNLSIQYGGMVDVPRGTDSTGEELAYILSHSGARVVIVHNEKQIPLIEAGLKKNRFKVKHYIILDNKIDKKKGPSVTKGTTIQTFADLVARGEALYKDNKSGVEGKILERHKKTDPSSLASIIYTSGTTGKPKGVMLTHRNYASQISLLPGPFKLGPSDRMLTLLPPWHVFGRVLEYIFFAAGVPIYYTNVKSLGDDLRRVKPTYVPAVPRVWEGIYNKVITGVKKGGKEKIFNLFKSFSLIHFRAMKLLLGQTRKYKRPPAGQLALQKLLAFLVIGLMTPLKILGHVLVFKKIIAATGGQLRGSISGGGALPPYIDEFFAAVGINIFEGYGLTETSPVIAVRLPGNIVMGTVGPVVPQTQVKLLTHDGVDVTTRHGETGTLYVRGPQVMKGYFNNPEKTAEVLDADGWLNTGDLVKLTLDNQVSIVGRSKDTIVLRGGENIEPTPIEEKIKESPLIENVMLIGQDQKNLGALIVPSKENLAERLVAEGVTETTPEEWAASDQVRKLLHKEVSMLVSTRNGFKNFEKIQDIRVLPKPFEVGDELSNTFKVKRFIVTKKYQKIIDDIYPAT